MEKKEYYRNILPHFQQPGQAYFVTWSLKEAVPRKAVKHYQQAIEEKQNQLGLAKTNKNEQLVKKLQTEYWLLRKKYFLNYDKLLAQKQATINLARKEITQLIIESLEFWEGKKLSNYAYCIMPNHIHWVFKTYEKDFNDNPVYLQDILHSVKRASAYKITQLLCRSGALWQKESFDTTIRNHLHLHRTIEYTLNNPVKAGLTSNWEMWAGSREFL